MQRGIGLIFMVGALAAAFVLGKAQAQEDGAAAAAAMQKAWMDLGKPGPKHSELKKKVGEWTAATTSWEAPGAEPKKSEGKCKYTMVMNGLILRQDYEGKMGDIPFTGVGYTAFNNGTGKYEGLWMDSMSSGMMFINGVENEKDNSVAYTGHFFGPGGVKVNSRMVFTDIDDDNHKFEMWMNFGQGEMKANEIVYKRVKQD